MLSFSRKSAGTKSLENLIDLFDKILIIAATDSKLKKQYAFKMIKIQNEYEKDLPFVSCEKTKIQQVILNILRNGAQAMQEAETENPQFIIRIFYKEDIKKITIEFENNGPCMTEDIQKKYLNLFLQQSLKGWVPVLA